MEKLDEEMNSLIGFGKRFAEMRIQADLTQECLAEKLHVTRKTISNWEAGSSFPDADYLIRMILITDCSPYYLLCGQRPDNIEDEKPKIETLRNENQELKIENTNLKRSFKLTSKSNKVNNAGVCLFACLYLFSLISMFMCLIANNISTSRMYLYREVINEYAVFFAGVVAAIFGVVTFILYCRKNNLPILSINNKLGGENDE